MIPIYQPYLTEKTKVYAKQAIDSGWISSRGQFLEECKIKLKALYPDHKVILTNNGTTAMHLVVLALKRKYPKINKVLVANNTYVAAWNCFLFNSDYKLVPVDADLDTWNFNTNNIETLIDEKTCILATHNIGNIINVPKLKKKFPEVPIIEDNCEGFLGKYNGYFSGGDCLASAVSFFANKTITSGEGGMFICKDEDIFEYINSVKNQGQSPIRYVHDYLGYNYRMTNVQAALLNGQLEALPEIVSKKNKIFDMYKKLLTHPNIAFQKIEPDTQHSNWMFGIRLKDFSLDQRKSIQFFLNQGDIDTREMFYPINSHKHLKKIDCDIANAKKLNEQCIILPSYPELNTSQLEFISGKILKYINNL